MRDVFLTPKNGAAEGRLSGEMSNSRQRQEKQETPRLEDYLEAIYQLIHEKGYAGTIDIAERLHVKSPTVSSMLQKLDKRGYLVHEPYRGMRLTEKGEQVAVSVIRRHGTIEELLSMLGVEKQVAYTDAEGIEHNLHPATIERLERLVEFLRENPRYLKAIREGVDEKGGRGTA